ncbi:hypothetical protein FD754_016392, partial [Muntiacus muntjak]
EPVGVVKAEPDPVEYTLRKRLPQGRPGGPESFISTRRLKLLGQGWGMGGRAAGSKGQNACTEIYIHHLGLPINRAIHIALQLQGGSLRSLHKAASTSAVEVVGELEPGTDTGEPVTQIRKLSKPHPRLQSHTQVIEMRLAHLKHPPAKN